MAKTFEWIRALVVAAVVSAPTVASAEFTGPVTICFLGDTGTALPTQRPWANKTHQLCKDAGAEAVVHVGDLDYIAEPTLWEDFINTEMGLDFPYFYVIGNHEADAPATLPVYQANLEARFNRLGIPWTGTLSQEASFDWRGIRFIMTKPGLPELLEHAEESAEFIREHASASDSPWIISFFHRQMRMMNVGDKGDATGWGVFEEGRKEGVMTWTGHHHSYGRTHLLSNMESQTIADDTSPYTLAKGVSLTVQTGLGGANAPRRRPRLAQSFLPYWAFVIAPPDIGDVPQVWGVNVCTFGAQGDPRRADCYFKTTQNAVIDSWTMYSVRDDVSPPVISASVSGPAGASGWFTGEVGVSWSVSDPESGIVSSSGCDSAVLSGETSGTMVTCSATNGNGLTASQSVTIKIDMTPPSVACRATPDSLWPPNHKLKPVTVSVGVADSLSGDGGFALSATASSESGDDDIVDFTIGSADTSGQLRAEREGGGEGRVYTLTYTGRDVAGNTSSCSATVSVPHDQGH